MKRFFLVLFALFLLSAFRIPSVKAQSYSLLPDSWLMDEQTEGNWRFALRETDGYAVITAYLGQESEPEVPSQLGGSDVAGIKTGAFSGMDYREISLPVTIVSIDEGSFGSGDPVIAAPHWSYALRRAAAMGLRTRDSSLYEFHDHVVDFSAAPKDHLKRNGYTSVEMNMLEALQLETGDCFWMLDRGNIDFHFRVLGKEQLDDNRVSVTVEVPKLGEVVSNQKMNKTIALTKDGVIEVDSDVMEKSFDRVSVEKEPIEFSLQECGITLLNGGSSSDAMTIEGSVRLNVIENYQYEQDGNDIVYMEMTEVVRGTVNMKLNLTGTVAGSTTDIESPLAIPVAANLTPPLSLHIIETGVFQVTATPSIFITVSGSITLSYDLYSTQRKVYNFSTDTWDVQDTWSQARPQRNSTSVKGEIEAAIGAKLELAASFFEVFKPLTVEIQAGVKATLGVEEVHFGDGAWLAGDPCLCIKIFGFADVKVIILGVTASPLHYESSTDKLDPPRVLSFHISPQYGVHMAKDCPRNSLAAISYDSRTRQNFEWVYIKPGTTLDPSFNYTPRATSTSGAFLGWADNPNTRVPNVTFGENGTVFNTNTTLFAVWENTVEVAFDTGVEGLTVPSQYVPAGGYAWEPEEPEHTGSLFNHWRVNFTESSAEWKFMSDTVPADGLLLHAFWFGDTEYTGGTTESTYIGYSYEISHDNFPKGEYTYEVIASDDDGKPLFIKLLSLVSEDLPNIAVPQTYTVKYMDGGEEKTTSAVVAVVAPGAFRNKENLRYVYFNFSGTVDLTEMFSGCSNLLYVDMSKTQLKDHEIQSYAFGDCSSLLGVKVPAGLMSIADHAFDGARLSCMFNLSDDILELGEYAFANTKIAAIGIPSNIRSIPNYLFYGSDNLYLVEFPERLLEVGDYAFQGCSNLAFADLPERVTSVGYYAFAETAIHNVELPDTVTEVYGNSFHGAPVTYMKWTAGIPVFPANEYNNSTENGYSQLIELVLPEGVTAIDSSNYFGYGALYDTPLESVSFPTTLKQIGAYAFYGCSSLSDLQFPNGYGIETIDMSAFSGCTSLTDPKFGEGLETIGEDAFSNTSISSVTLPDTVTEVYGSSFHGAPVTYMKWTAGIPVFPANEFNNSGVNAYSQLKELVLPEGVTAIDSSNYFGYGALYDTPLESVSFPTTLKQIGAYAFYGCSSLSDLQFPNGYGIETIDMSAFSGCTSLTDPKFGEGLETIGEDAFSNTSISSVTLPDTVTEVYGSSFHGAPVTYMKWTAGIPVFPANEFNNSGVNQYSQLKELVLPEGVTAIDSSNYFERGALYDTPLESVSFPTTLKQIGAYAFYGCSSLSNLQFPNGYGIETIDMNAFSGCTSLTDPKFEEGLVTIGINAFSNTSISSVTLPDTVTEVYGSSFSGAPVTYMKWTAGIPVFPANEFNNSGVNQYSQLKELVLPEGVTAIASSDYFGYGALYDTPLESVSFPITLKQIGTNAFYGCENLQNVYYGGSPKIKALLMTISSENSPLDTASWHYAISDGNFSLPPQLTAIQSEAFNGTPLIIVEIPASVTGIGDRAFAASASLRALLFLNGNVTLCADVLKDSDQAVVICPAGGTVEEWCVRNDVIYVTY